MATDTAFSRYRWTETKVDDFVAPGRMRNQLWHPVLLMSRPETELQEGTYDIYTVKEPDIGRLDILAWRFYGDVNLWWALAYYNNIREPLEDMVVGAVLKVPKKDFLLNQIEVEGRGG